MNPVELGDAEFAEVRALALRLSGISLNPGKKALVVSRWGGRLSHHGLASFREYLDFIRNDASGRELQISLDLLTTNETYFFREPRHFEFLRTEVLPAYEKGGRLRIWSAACSSGEEPYSIAMLLAAHLPRGNWEVLGSDISSRMLACARVGLYDMARARDMPADFLRRFCLKGVGPNEGKILVDRPIRDKVTFELVNLNEALPQRGDFDVIFLRNVMIYFSVETKAAILARLVGRLRSGGLLVIGHSDTLHGVAHGLDVVRTSILRKPAP